MIHMNENKIEKRYFTISIMLSLVALISVVMTTVAWFTIADFAKINNMKMEITSGRNLRFDLDAHDVYDEYVQSLSFEQIAQRINSEHGYDMKETHLKPVTTDDYMTFVFEEGTIVNKSSGAYLEFVLHFMATEDMVVHLTSENSNGATDGTLINSNNKNLPKAMRISFSTDDMNYIYDPRMGNSSIMTGNVKKIGLPSSDEMVLNDDNQMFRLEKNVDCPVVVRVWLEGTDPNCTDDLRNADYSISLRFEGTDYDNNRLVGDRN